MQGKGEAAPLLTHGAGGAGPGGMTFHLALCVFTSLLGSFQFGYNSGVINVPEKEIMDSLDLSETQFAVIVSIFCLGGFIGTQVGGSTVDKLGRARSLQLNALLFIVGGVAMYLCPRLEKPYGYWVLLASRVLVGIGSGLATVAAPMYVTEVSPAALKGPLAACNQLGIVIGLLVSIVLGMIPALDSKDGWPYLLGFVAPLGLLQFLLVPAVSRSPTFLLARGDKQAALKALTALRGSTASAEDVEHELSGLIADSRGHHGDDEDDGGDDGGRKRSSVSSGGGGARRGERSLWSVLSDPSIRLALVTTVVLHMTQQLSGINAMMFYSTGFFRSAGMQNAQLGTLLVQTVNTAATFLAVLLIERLGRRTLLLSSIVGMLASAITVAACMVLGGTHPDVKATLDTVSLVAVMTFVGAFEIGLGPIPWQAGSEIFPDDSRSAATGMGAAINWSCNLAIAQGFLPLQHLLGSYVFVPFAVVLLLSGTFLVRYFPETKGRTPRQVLADFDVRAGKTARRAPASVRIDSAV